MAEKFTKTAPMYSETERSAYADLVAAARSRAIPDSEYLGQLQLFQSRADLSHTLFLNELYEKIVYLPGNIAEFGTRWGRNLALFTSLRSLYEPHNFSRKIIGFDTFGGFPPVAKEDGSDVGAAPGAYGVEPGWEHTLERILRAHQELSMRPHLKRFELVKGDVRQTGPRYLEKFAHAIFALLYLDLDLYEPTKKVIEMFWPRLVRGGVIVFDELNFEGFPGETLAVLESLGLSANALVRSKFCAFQAYLIKS